MAALAAAALCSPRVLTHQQGQAPAPSHSLGPQAQPCLAPLPETSHCAPASQCALGSRDSSGNRTRGLQARPVSAGPARQAASSAQARDGVPSIPLSLGSLHPLPSNGGLRGSAGSVAFSQPVQARTHGAVGTPLSSQPFPFRFRQSTRGPTTQRWKRVLWASGGSAASSASSQHNSSTPLPPHSGADTPAQHHSDTPAPSQDQAQFQEGPHTAPTGAQPKAGPPPSNGGMGFSDGQGSGAAYVVVRVIWGAAIGALAFSAILRGGWAFAVLLGGLCGMGCWEYQGLVRRRCAIRSLQAPSLGAAAIASIASGLMPPITLMYGGQEKMALAAGAAAVGAVLLLQPTRPRLSEISSLSFGSLYCGFLATYWVKVVSQPEKWTLGLAATFLGFAGIIAADTGAYVGGKLMGRTPLTDISPNKTWEGAISGLCSCILISLWVARSLLWPAPPFWTGVLATCVFFAALFGDLSESMLKRDAGVKDAGHLIPGHGGVLDRTDSYVFTGLTVFAFVRFVLPLVAAS